jgi:hypothetical protein
MLQRRRYSETGLFGRHFDKVGNLNKSMQSPQITILTQIDEIHALIK